jgi:predicted deacylase
VLWLNGLVHGDEVNGAVAGVRALQSLDPETFRGTVVCTPVSNPTAYLARQRISFTDNLDLDQQFPGAQTGLTTQRIAHRLFSMIRATATHVISFHSVGTPMTSVAYAVFKRVPDADATVVSESARIALAFGTKVTCMVDVATAAGELPGQLAGSLDLACIHAGIPSFMAEIGGGGRLQQESTARGIGGVRNVMRALEMLHDEADGDATPGDADRVVITKRRFLIADRGGIWEMTVQPAEIVREGQLIGTISSWLGDSTEIRAPHDLYTILLRANPAVHEGDRLAFVGTEWMPATQYMSPR